MSGTKKATPGKVITGGCLCDGVRYRITGELRGVINCFCGQCRKTSGHHVAATRVNLADFELIDDSTLHWYDSSQEVRRGFCRKCGGNLFWQNHCRDTISIMAGTLDAPTGLATIDNIYTDDASDYQIIPELDAGNP